MPQSDFATDWPAVNQLLDEALALPPTERQAWLAALPPEQATLKDTLARLLAVQADIETGNFLGTLPRFGTLPPPDAGTAAVGDQVGPWRLLRELGAGGMGSVWLAERADGSLKRQVALKLPRLAWASDLAARMARERDILASLEHPHIARLYDAGLDASGRPWLALEFVDGRPIDAYCRDKALTIRQRVELLVQVCAAVAYAHSRLVIHRDLKPANIFVTDDGQVRLLDFGIATLLQSDASVTALTEVGGRILTLDYASPEQVRGEVLTTTSDVYSLGVVAYELLTGSRPYRLRRGSAAELEEAIAAADIPAASSRAHTPATARALRGDLDAVLAQALRKDVAARYASAEALAADLRRHLDGLPVRAVPDSAGYRARRFLRRHWKPIGAAAAVAASLVLGSGIALWQAAQAREEAAVALAVQDFLQSVFSANTGDQVRPGSGRETTARELLDRGAERITTTLRDVPRARLRLLKVMAAMYEDLNAFDRARDMQERRLAVAREVERGGGEETVLALADLANALLNTGREVDARQALDEAEAVLAARPGLGDLPRLRVALRRASVHRADDPARALAAAEQALVLARRQPPSIELVLALSLAGEARFIAGDVEGSVPLLTEGIALAEQRPELGASVLSVMYSMRGEALQRRGAGAAAVAESDLRRALEIERARGTQGVLPHYLAFTLGSFLHGQDRWRESLDTLAPSLPWARAQVAAGQSVESTVPGLLAAYGRSMVAWGPVEQGLQALDEAERALAGFQDAPDLVAPVRLFRADALMRLGRLADAGKVLDAAEQLIAERKTGHERLAVPVRRDWLIASRRGAQALQAWADQRRAAQLPELPADGEDPRVRITGARLLLAAGDAARAAEQAESALAALRAAGGEGSAAVAEADAAHWLGRARLAKGEAAAALPPLERALELRRRLHDTETSLELAETLDALAQARRLSGDAAGHREARRLAEAIRARHPMLAGAEAR